MADGYQGRGGYGGRGFRGGFKRRREEEVMDPVRLLLSKLMSFGESTMPSMKLDQDQAINLAKQIKRESRSNPETMLQMLINCATELPAKMPIYTLLVALINVEEPDFVKKLIEQVGKEFNESLQSPSSYRKARLLLRFLTLLTISGTIQSVSLIDLLKKFVETAIEVADSAMSDDDSSWQPYSDYLVYMAVIALPFGGHELASSVPSQILDFMSTVDVYMGKRKRTLQLTLCPFGSEIHDDDPLTQCDCGAASFLSHAVDALKEMLDPQREGKGWGLLSIPRVHEPFELSFAEAREFHPCPEISIPLSPPVTIPSDASFTVKTAMILEAFPPRGIIRFLEDKHTLGDRLHIERIITEDYIIDSIAAFEKDRVESAKCLARSLPLPYQYDPLLCEVLFSQMLRLPTPEFKPIMYGTLMVDLCKLMKIFPRAMSACMRECFSRMESLDPSLRERLAEWLAYHLSNFEYVWPWSKWEHVLGEPPFNAQRRFCVEVIHRMVRLSFWDKINGVLPEEFKVLLPPKPEVAALPTSEEDTDTEGVWAAQALKMVRSKASAEEIDAWMNEKELETVLGGKIGVMKMLARCLLVAGSKSYTHMIIALERYYGPLAMLSKECGTEGQIALVGTVIKTWAANPQRALMAIDRMMILRLISAEAIISWVFGDDGLRCIGNELRSNVSWEMLLHAVDKTLARVQDAREDLDAGRAAVDAARAAVEAGVGRAEDVEQAQGALPEKEAYLVETTQQQKGAILQALKSFIGSFDAEKGLEEKEKSALHEYLMACLRSFLLRYLVPVAVLEGEVDDLFKGIGSEEVKKVVESQLRI